MFSRNQKILATVVSTLALVVVSNDIQARGRSVRSDSSDGAFNFLGGFWGDDQEQFGATGFDVGLTEFKLRINPNGTAKFFRVCMGDGFIKLVDKDAACSSADFALPPSGNYIAAFAADLDDSNGSLRRTRGFVDFAAPYKLWQAKPAMRFWWNGVILTGDSTFSGFDAQIVLIDRSNGTNNGNFDLEFNYGTGGGDVVPPVPASGFQGYALGPNKSGPTSGPFGPFDTNGDPIRYCFRSGKKGSCG